MSSYGSYQQNKGIYAPRPSTSSTTSSASLYAQSARSSRGYGGKATVVVHKPSGPINDPNTSTSAPHGGYWK